MRVWLERNPGSDVGEVSGRRLNGQRCSLPWLEDDRRDRHQAPPISDYRAGISRRGRPAEPVAWTGLELLAAARRHIDSHVRLRQVVGQDDRPLSFLVGHAFPVEAEVDAAFQVAVLRVAVAHFVVERAVAEGWVTPVPGELLGGVILRD